MLVRGKMGVAREAGRLTDGVFFLFLVDVRWECVFPIIKFLALCWEIFR